MWRSSISVNTKLKMSWMTRKSHWVLISWPLPMKFCCIRLQCEYPNPFTSSRRAASGTDDRVFVGNPLDHAQFSDSLDGLSRTRHIVTLPGIKTRKEYQQQGMGHGTKSRRKQAQASKSLLPVVSHRTHKSPSSDLWSQVWNAVHKGSSPNSRSPGFFSGISHISTVCLTPAKIPDSQKESKCSVKNQVCTNGLGTLSCSHQYWERWELSWNPSPQTLINGNPTCRPFKTEQLGLLCQLFCMVSQMHSWSLSSSYLYHLKPWCKALPTHQRQTL